MRKFYFNCCNLIFCLVTFLGITTADAQSVLTLQPDAAAGKDAFVSEIAGETTTNFGTNQEFTAQSFPKRRGYIRFDLSSIPVNATVISAYLSLYAYNLSGGHQLGAYSFIYLNTVNQAWDEATVTWTNQPFFTTSGSIQLPVTDSVNQNYLNIDVRNLVQISVTTPANNFGYVLTQGNGGRLMFGSSDNANATLRPKLVVTYAICGGAPPSASITPTNPAAVCAGSSVSLTANSGAGFTYQWFKNGTFVSGGSSPVFAAATSGTYTVKVTNPQGCTALSSGVNVSVLLENAYISANTYYTNQGCLNGGMNLSATAAPGNTYQWRRDGNNIVGATASTYSTSIAGNYSCYMTNSGCTLTSNTIPAAMQVATLTTYGPNTFCTNTNTSLYISLNIGSGQQTYQWMESGIDIPGATNYIFVPQASGYYQCRVTESTFCHAPVISNASYITANTPPPIGIISAIAGNPVNLCNGQSTDFAIIDLSSGLQWGDTGVTWFRNGIQVGWPGSSPYLQMVTETGDYDAYLVTTCGSSYTSPGITVHSANPGAELPEIYVSGSACDSVYIMTSSYLPWDGYLWKRNGIPIPGATGEDYYALLSGNYSCVFYNGCDSIESAVWPVTILNASAVITSPGTTLCSGLTMQLSANTNPGISSYQWKLNGINIPGATAANYITTSGGNYSCVLTGPCGTFTSNTIPVILLTSPAAVLTIPSPAFACTAGTINLTSNTAAGFAYSWLKDGSAIAGASQAGYAATTNGNYAVKITASNNCVDTSDIIKVLFGPPAATVSSIDPTTVCVNYFYHLTATATGLTNSYQWRANGVIIPGATSATYNFKIQQTTTFTVDVTNECDTASSPGFLVTVNPLPTNTLTAGGPVTFCAPGSVTLNTGGGAGLSYKWYLNNLSGLIAGATSATYPATTSGAYFAVVTNTASGCSTTTNTIRVSSSGLMAAITPATTPVSACTSLAFTANGGAGNTYQWRNNNVNISGATSQSYTATTSGYYDVIITGACGSNTSNAVSTRIDPATISQAGTIVYPAVPTSCAGQNIHFGINRFVLPPYVSNDLIQWNLNGSPIAGANATTYSASQSGGYTVSLTNACGVVTSAPEVVTINPLPVITISAGGPTIFCNGGSVNLTATTGAGYSHQWKRNGIDIPGATATSFAANQPGTYICRATLPTGCTKLSNFINVTVNTIVPVVTPGGAVSVCSGATITLFAASGPGYIYQWKKYGIAIAGATGSSYTATTAGNYTVQVTNACGTNTSATTSVTIIALPTASITTAGPTTFCSGQSVVLNANTGAGLTYQWKKYANIIAGATSSSYSATKTGNYKVVVSNSSGCTRTSNTISVTVNPLPSATITAGGPISFCASDSVTLTANAGAGLTYQWKRNTSLISGATSIFYRAKTAGNYRCIVTNTNGCTKTSNTITVTVPCRNVGDVVVEHNEEQQVLIYPNPSSGDFSVVFKSDIDESVSLKVYDLTGRIIHNAITSINENTYQVSGLTPGVYVLEIISGSKRTTYRLVRI